jgi:DNA-binding response OmpR family regulator
LPPKHRISLADLAPIVSRVVILDAHLHGARLLGDIVKQLGSREVVIETDGDLAMETVRSIEPTLILTEMSAGLDGLAFVRTLRRSTLGCRQAPVIMLAAKPTASRIRQARDAGVHEFVRKPYASAEIVRRIEGFILRPRGWLENRHYVGPDRRRFSAESFHTPKRRRSDQSGDIDRIQIAIQAGAASPE